MSSTTHIVTIIMNIIEWIRDYGLLLGFVALSFVIALLIIKALIQVIIYLISARTRFVSFLMIPPTTSLKTAQADSEFFKVLHASFSSPSYIKAKLGIKERFVLEFASTKPGGIGYIVSVPQKLSDNLRHTFHSFMPELKIEHIDEHIESKGLMNSYYLKKHFAFPLATARNFNESDPIDYIAGALTKLDDDESIRAQLVITPTYSREAERLAADILTNKETIRKLSSSRNNHLLKIPLAVISSVSSNLLESLSSLFWSDPSYSPQSRITSHREEVAQGLKPSRQTSQYEDEIVSSMNDKLARPLFEVSIRSLVSAPSRFTRRMRSKMIKDAFGALRNGKYQSLRSSYMISTRINRRIFSNRMHAPTRSKRSILGSSELASLYHFPSGNGMKTENVVSSLSRTLPAPLSLKDGSRFDVVFGRNEHHGESTLIGLTTEERERHMFIIGGTGNGKTTMMKFMIMQDIQNGKGVAVIDPHGDMADEIIASIPKHREKDVIFFNPEDIEYPLGINLLEVDTELKGDALLMERDKVVESVVSVFRKLFSEDDAGGHRVEYIVRNTAHTALTVKDATLFTMLKLINNPGYRKRVVAKLDDSDLKDFWRNEFGEAGKMQKVKMAGGVTAKIGRFRISLPTSRVLGQPKSTINFEDIINTGKILICRFQKDLGEDTSSLFGTTILAKLQLAAYKRARIPYNDRRPFHIYVDEFQNFATQSFVQILSEARKYKLFITMAEQSTSQQKDQQMVNIILANVGTVVSFRTGNAADEDALIKMFAPFVKEGEIAYLPSYNYYARLAAIHSQAPLSGVTILPDSSSISSETRESIIENSRTLYATHIKAKIITENNEADEPITLQAEPGAA